MVSMIAHELARRYGRVSVLQVVPYVPLDVDSVARILESLDELASTHRIQGEDGIDYYTFDDQMPAVDLERGEHLKDNTALTRNVHSLCEDPHWSSRARAQHLLLKLVAESPREAFTADFLASRSRLTGSKIQSALNDFVAQKYVHMLEQEDAEALYIFPKITYPQTLVESNLAALAPVEESRRINKLWWLVAIVSTIVLIFVVLELL